MSDLKRRLVVSMTLIVMIIVLLVFAQNPVMEYVATAAIALLSAVALWEYAQFAKTKGGNFQLLVFVGLGGLVTVSFCPMVGRMGMKLVPQLAFLMALLLLFALHFRDKTGAVIDLAVSTFGLLYIALPMGMILAILYWPLFDNGKLWVAYLLAVTKLVDMGAYFGGNLWGRHKLAPQISPQKTIEGAIVGFFVALFVSICFHLLGTSMSSLRLSITLPESLCLGGVLGIIGQFGDLSESLLKRDADKKDSNGLPGLGGVLDAVDSLLFNAPIVYFYLIISRS